MERMPDIETILMHEISDIPKYRGYTYIHVTKEKYPKQFLRAEKVVLVGDTQRKSRALHSLLCEANVLYGGDAEIHIDVFANYAGNLEALTCFVDAYKTM